MDGDTRGVYGSRSRTTSVLQPVPATSVPPDKATRIIERLIRDLKGSLERLDISLRPR